MNTLRTAVTNFVGGDESAFNDIYYTTYRVVSLVACRYLKNQADAEDAIQDTYIKIFENLYTIRDADKAMSWILALTRNTCLNKLEKKIRTETTVMTDEESLLSVFSKVKDEHVYTLPEQNLLAEEQNKIICDILSALPLEQRDAVMLHYIEKMSVAEIAEITNVTAGTVKSRLNYARQKLRRNAFRVKKDIPAQICLLDDCSFLHKGDRETEQVIIKNISMSGLMFLSDKEHYKKERLSIGFDLEPNELYPESIKMDIKVARSCQISGLNEVGVTYDEEEVNEVLRRYIMKNLYI